MNRKSQVDPTPVDENPFVWKPRAEPVATARDRLKLIVLSGLYVVWIGFLVWMATR